ncbi:3-hydroxyacyl-CoA dehydrogenase NAD-binding domain-containing protein [Streptomyces rugosispiralis]|uniref:3-hydroxyacyl-CoA dehydrogenase NAD-binding domain-containing protein n=1 Tax=Streptomyces rugosispiralis TaxID=2967341 RepID=A0ABT1UR36_9ACTN|nr:3-hydroxyacyl-CoA dehydrogenase NAD-binding domain-containing protein [Streptomyces rugosispiralis]MCQ8186811.1 3-hydroxyacyl-CoA dehydrogenase NAD-binding domain-containing protein [Streptomyces rugosispiralis]
MDVILVDVSDDVLRAAEAEIAQQLRHGRFMGAFPGSRATGTLTTTPSGEAAADAIAVIEAITADSSLKARMPAEVSGVVAPGTTMAPPWPHAASAGSRSYTTASMPLA